MSAFKQSFLNGIGFSTEHEAIVLARLGQIDEAKAQVRLMLEKNDPKFTQAKWREEDISTAIRCQSSKAKSPIWPGRGHSPGK